MELLKEALETCCIEEESFYKDLVEMIDCFLEHLEGNELGESERYKKLLVLYDFIYSNAYQKKLKINHNKLQRDLTNLTVDELENMGNVFLIYSHDDKYDKTDMRKACNMVIGELRRRGITDEEDLLWED